MALNAIEFSWLWMVYLRKNDSFSLEVETVEPSRGTVVGNY